MADWGPWYIYVVANHTEEEIYIGVVRDRGAGERWAGVQASVRSRWRRHCGGDTLSLAHWDCSVHDLELLSVRQRLTQSGASRRAHEMERFIDVLERHSQRAAELADDGYNVILTAGI